MKPNSKRVEFLLQILRGANPQLGEVFFRKETMEATLEGKPLHPLSNGNILIVGAKASNFDEEIRTHPRIVFWDSQHEHWTDKDIPSNTRAVFVTRWIGHNSFRKILREARKRQITMFNPEGTGMIVKQVKELLDIQAKPLFEKDYILASEVEETTPMTVQKTSPTKGESKLNPLIPFIDTSKSHFGNAKILYEKAKELGIETTVGSIANFVSRKNRKQSYMKRPGARKPAPTKAHKQVDVIVEILDNMVKELQDMRDYLVATTEENKQLKQRFEMFKKALSND